MKGYVVTIPLREFGSQRAMATRVSTKGFVSLQNIITLGLRYQLSSLPQVALRPQVSVILQRFWPGRSYVVTLVLKKGVTTGYLRFANAHFPRVALYRSFHFMLQTYKAEVERR
jgi:hypothetical protein